MTSRANFIKVLLGLLAVVVSVLLGVLISSTTNPFRIFDDNLYQILYISSPHTVTGFMIAITTLGNTGVVIFCSIVAVGCFALRRRLNDALVWVISIGVTELFVELLKNFFAVDRPPLHLIDVTGASYPSGHASAISAIGTPLILLVSPHIKDASVRTMFNVVCLAIVVLVSISRLYLGVHWSSDVVGGVLLGSGVALVSHAGILWLKLPEKKS